MILTKGSSINTVIVFGEEGEDSANRDNGGAVKNVRNSVTSFTDDY
jgi:hypothetical protein